MRESEKDFCGCLGIVLSMPLVAVTRGWALSVLWGWFVVTSLHAPPLRIPQAIGLAVVYGMVTGSSFAKEDEKYTMPIKMASWMLGPFFSLGMGWIVRQWL